MYIYNRLDHDQSSILKRVTLGLSAKMLRMIFSGGQGFGASVPAGEIFVDKVRGKVSWQTGKGQIGGKNSSGARNSNASNHDAPSGRNSP